MGGEVGLPFTFLLFLPPARSAHDIIFIFRQNDIKTIFISSVFVCSYALRAKPVNWSGVAKRRR